jgi:hypothetical protein
MVNLHKIVSVALGLVFMITLQAFSNPQPVFRFLIPAFIVVLAITFFYNRYYLRVQNKYKLWVAVRPLLLQVSAFLFYIVLLNSFFRGIFFVVAVFLIAIFEMFLAKYSENIFLNETLLGAFGFCFAFLAFSQEYFYTYTPLFAVGIFVALFLLARSFYEFLPITDKAKTLNALLIAFLSAQVFWVVNFLPFHYSAISLLLLNFFYVALVLNYYYLLHTLSKQKIKFYLSLSAISMVLVFSATPWSIVD